MLDRQAVGPPSLMSFDFPASSSMRLLCHFYLIARCCRGCDHSIRDGQIWCWFISLFFPQIAANGKTKRSELEWTAVPAPKQVIIRCCDTTALLCVCMCVWSNYWNIWKLLDIFVFPSVTLDSCCWGSFSNRRNNKCHKEGQGPPSA